MALLNIPKGEQYAENHRDRSYTQVVKRKGQKFTAEELNYEGQIGQFHTEALYQDILGPMFIGDAFKVVAPAPYPENNNSLVITAGKLYTRLGELILPEGKTYEQVKSDIIALPPQYRDYVTKATYNDFDSDHIDYMITTPSSDTRTDLLVLVITKLLIGSDLDPQIKDNVLGEDSAGRYKLFYSFRIMKGMNLTSEWQNSFTYENDFICRIPLAVIKRTAGFDLITDANIIDHRATFGEVMTTPLYKKVLNHITAIQGSGKGFNADMVDGRNVNDDIDPSVHTLWTSKKTQDYVEIRAKGIIPEKPVESYIDADQIPVTPTPGFRYIVAASNDVDRPNFKVDHIYTYITGGGGEFYGYSETAPKQGMLLINRDTSAFMMYSETALEEPGVYGNHWFDFGGISNHASLSSVLKVEEDLDDTILKHMTDLQYKTIKDDIVTNASQINAQGISFTSHTTANPIDHPDKSVTFDKVVNHTIDDSVTLSTSNANVGELLNRIGTAIKTLAGGANWQTSISKKLNESGGTLTGNLTLNSSSKLISQNTTDASSSDGAIQTLGGISVAQKGYFGTGLTVASGGASITGSGTFSGLLTAANFKTGSSGGNISNTGTGGIGGCISILGTVSLTTSTPNPSAISVGNNSTASGVYSIALGVNSSASGDFSTALGYNSTASGLRSTALGRVSTASGNNSTALGYNSTASVDNRMTLGNSSTKVYLGSGSAVTSDARDKTEIEENDLGLDFLKKIRTAKYKINHRDRYYKRDENGNLLLDDNKQPVVDEDEHKKGTKKGTRWHRGVIAQELEAIIDTNEFSAVKHSTVNNPGQYDDYAVDYIQFIPVMIKAIQELSEKNDELRAEIEFLKLS